MNQTEIRQRREDIALTTFRQMLANHPTKTWELLAYNAVRAADALIAELDKQS